MKIYFKHRLKQMVVYCLMAFLFLNNISCVNAASQVNNQIDNQIIKEETKQEEQQEEAEGEAEDESNSTPEEGVEQEGQQGEAGDESSSTPEEGEEQEGQQGEVEGESSNTPEEGVEQEGQQGEAGDESSSTPEEGVEQEEQQGEAEDELSNTPEEIAQQEELQEQEKDKSNDTPEQALKRKELEELLEELDNLNEIYYTKDSWDEFKEKRGQIDINQIPGQYLELVIKGLKDAKDGLVEVSKREALKNLIKQIDILKIDKYQYTDDSWGNLEAERNQIQNVDEIPSQWLQGTIDRLQGFKDNLVEVNRREQLKNLIKEIDALEEEEYTTDSWNVLIQKRSEIKNVDEIPEDAIQETIDNLKNARDSLVKKGLDTNLDEGYYLLPMSSWQIDKKNAQAAMCNPENPIKKQVLLEVGSEQYKVTFGIRKSDKVHGFGILKDRYLEDDRPWGQMLGTLNWREGFNVEESNIHQDIKNGAIEANNQYWYSYETNNGANNTRYITFSPSGITNDFRVHMIDEGGYAYLDFNEAVAKKIDIEQVKSKNKMKYYLYFNTELEWLKGIDNYFNKEAADWKVSDNRAVAKIVLDSSINEKYTEIKIGETKDNLNPLSDNSFSVEFDLSNCKDVVLGKTIYIQAKKDGYTNSNCITIYPEITDRQEVEIEEQTRGSRILSNTHVILPETKLVTTDIVDTSSPYDAYTLITNNVKYEKRCMFNLHIEQNQKKEIRLSEKAKVKFLIPKEWDKHKVKLFAYCEYKGFETDVTGEIEDIGDNSYFVIETTNLGSYALYQVEEYTATGENLEDGTYEIPVSVFKLTHDDEISMSDACLGDNATLIVKDKVKTLYLDFTPVKNLQLESYMTKMNIYGSDMVMEQERPTGTLLPITVTSFYKNEQGDFLTDAYNKNSINYYPKTGYIQLVSDEHRWPVRFSVPIMDVIAGNDNDQDAWLALYWKEAKKISDETPAVPIKGALKQLIDIGNIVPSDRLTDDTRDIFNENLQSANTVHSNNNATAEEIHKAYSDLKVSIDEINGYKIVYNSSINGSIKAQVDGQPIEKGQLIPKGKTVVFTAIPEDGYVVKSWSGVNNQENFNVVSVKVDSKINVHVDFKKEDEGSGGEPQQGEDTLKKGNYYYVGISLWHEVNNQASMGDAAFSNNRRALVYVNNDESYSFQACTNPVKIDDITAGLGSIFSSSVNNLMVVSTQSLTNGENYISKFTFDVSSKYEYYPITVTVPGSPMVGNFGARLRIDWNSATKTSTTNLMPYSGVTVGEAPSEIPESQEDVKDNTDKKFKENDLKKLIKEGKDLIVKDKDGVKAKFDVKSIKAIAEKAGADNVTVEISGVKSSQLNKKQKKVVGDRPIYRFTVKADNKKITNFGEGEVEITLPYTLKKDEKADSIIVWYIDENGKIEKIDCAYDKESKAVVFTTNHFSIYVIAKKEVKVWKNPFTDISKSDVYYDDISYIVQKGLFDGTSKGKFSPQMNMSRAMLVTVLWRMKGSPNVDLTEMKLTDVIKGSYYEKAVAWAINNKIACGYEDNSFRPNEELTMEQLVVIIQRYAKLTDNYARKSGILDGYGDYADISTYAKDAMEWAFSMNLVEATDNNTILPKRTITRAQVAQILKRFYLKNQR